MTSSPTEGDEDFSLGTSTQKKLDIKDMPPEGVWVKMTVKWWDGISTPSSFNQSSWAQIKVENYKIATNNLVSNVTACEKHQQNLTATLPVPADMYSGVWVVNGPGQVADVNSPNTVIIGLMSGTKTTAKWHLSRKDALGNTKCAVDETCIINDQTITISGSQDALICGSQSSATLSTTYEPKDGLTGVWTSYGATTGGAVITTPPGYGETGVLACGLSYSFGV